MKLKLRTGILVVLGIMLIFSVPLMANTEEVKVPFEAIKSSCYGEIDMTKAEFSLSEVGKKCVADDWLEANLSQVNQQQQAKTTEKEAKIPEIFQLNASMDFDKEAIEEWAENHSWKKAWELTIDSHDRKSGDYTLENFMDIKNVRLYTPLLTWVETNRTGKQRFWSKEKTQETYQKRLVKPNEGTFFLCQLVYSEKSVLNTKNFRFVLEDEEGRHQDASHKNLRNIRSKSIIPGTNTYLGTIDVWFDFSEEERPSWDRLTLYIIRTDLVKRTEFTWDFE